MDNTGKLEKTKDPGGFWSHEHFKYNLIFFFSQVNLNVVWNL